MHRGCMAILAIAIIAVTLSVGFGLWCLFAIGIAILSFMGTLAYYLWDAIHGLTGYEAPSYDYREEVPPWLVCYTRWSSYPEDNE